MKIHKCFIVMMLVFIFGNGGVFCDEKEVPYEKKQAEFFELVKNEFPDLQNYKTKHFSINYTMKMDSFTKKLPKTLEAFLMKIKKIMSIPTKLELYEGRLEVYFWERRADYIKFADTFDHFNARSSGGYFTVTKMGWARINIPLENGGSNLNTQRAYALKTLFHEGTHGVFAKYRSDVRLPTWLNEGMADYFAFTIMKKYYPKLNGMMRSKRRYIKHVEYGLKNGNLRSFRKLFHQQGTMGGADIGQYALGWVSSSFLFKNYKKRFVKYLRACKDSEVLQSTQYKSTPGEKKTPEEWATIRAKIADASKLRAKELEDLFEKCFSMDIDKFGELFYASLQKSKTVLKNL